jgi:K(+)-stimulated pyrophosphate-energized sodium pump
MNIPSYTIYDLAWIAALIALIYALYNILSLRRYSQGNERMKEIANAVRIGAEAFLKREYSVILPAGIVLALAIYFVSPIAALGFVIGGAFSALAGYIGMGITVRTSARVANIASKGIGHALSLAYKGGSVMGFAVAGFALIGLSLFLFTFKELIVKDPALIAGLGFGASLIALFMRVGGGIYTKAADLGADLVGKVEAGIPEDDPRNPAVIADNVGDNVGDAAGMGSDIYESYIVIGIAAIILGVLLSVAESAKFGNYLDPLMFYPLMIGASGILGSIIGSTVVNPRLGNRMEPMRVLDLAFIISAVLTIVIGSYISFIIFPSNIATSLTVALISGVIVVVAIEKIVDYFTSYNYKPTKFIVESSKISPAHNFLAGYTVGLQSAAPAAVILVATIIISYLTGYYFTGSHLFAVYATAILTMAMLSLTGIVMSVDSYGPITDNAAGNAEMSNLGEDIRKILDKLDSVGNTVKATTKGFAIASAALSALALFLAFQMEVINKAKEIPRFAEIYGQASIQFLLSDPKIIVGLLVGGLLPFLFSSYLIRAVGRTSMKVVEEVRRQFKEIPGLLEGKAKPDYAKCVDIVTKESLKELALPGFIAIASPLILGLILGPLALGGLLIGSVVSGVFLALLMANAGAAWDNAKKLVELSGMKRSELHKVTVYGDTVGDPWKDTAGPSLNSLIKVLNTFSIVFLSVIMVYALII